MHLISSSIQRVRLTVQETVTLQGNMLHLNHLLHFNKLKVTNIKAFLDKAVFKADK